MTPEEKREYMREWKKNNSDKVKAYNKKYREEHKYELNLYKRLYRARGRVPKAYDSVTGEEIKL